MWRVTVVVVALAFPAVAQTVTDGDTIKQGGVIYRLWGIDAPETKQACPDGWPAGSLATTRLKALNGGSPCRLRQPRQGPVWADDSAMHGCRRRSRRYPGARGVGVGVCALQPRLRRPRGEGEGRSARSACSWLHTGVGVAGAAAMLCEISLTRRAGQRSAPVRCRAQARLGRGLVARHRLQPFAFASASRYLKSARNLAGVGFGTCRSWARSLLARSCSVIAPPFAVSPHYLRTLDYCDGYSKPHPLHELRPVVPHVAHVGADLPDLDRAGVRLHHLGREAPDSAAS